MPLSQTHFFFFLILLQGPLQLLQTRLLDNLVNDIAGAADPNCLAPDSSHPGQFVFGIWDHYPIVYLDHYPSVYDAIGRVGNSPHWDLTRANLSCGMILVTSGTAVKPVVVV